MPSVSASSSFPEQLNWAMWTARLSEEAASSIFSVFDGNFLWLIYHLEFASLHFDKENLGNRLHKSSRLKQISPNEGENCRNQKLIRLVRTVVGSQHNSLPSVICQIEI